MRRCWETAGRLIWKCPAIVLTERSASRRRSSIRRRAGWLIAPKTSGSRLAVTTMSPVYVRKYLRVKHELDLIVVLDVRVPQVTLRDKPRSGCGGFAGSNAWSCGERRWSDCSCNDIPWRGPAIRIEFA